MKPTIKMLDTAAAHFRSARGSMLEGAKLLHEIATMDLWKGSYSSLAEYIELECQISRGFASKLMKVYATYVVEGKMPMEKLKGIDMERLYLATALKLPHVERAEQAAVLSRTELNATVRDEIKGECSHPPADQEMYHRCRSCGGFSRV